MIAEIYNKISSTGSNLTERLEDQLTGNFFGSLRYLPFDCGIKSILQKAAFPVSLLDCIDNVSLNEWADKIYFWGDCRYDGTEPDVIIELDNTVILIEVKLDSGVGENQLEREAELLLQRYSHCDNKFLILLACELYAEGIYEEYEKAIKSKGVEFGYITWQKALAVLNGITIADLFQKVIVSDLVELMIKKGFDVFRCVDEDLPTINPKDYWGVSSALLFKFGFEYVEEIGGDLYYEF